MPTIGQSDAKPFVQRGSKKPLEDWTKNPRNTMAPQQYGYGVTPQTCVKPRAEDDFSYKAGRNLPELNVGRPGRKK